MATVKHKILELSCKGGVGKSTFSAQLSFALAGMDYQVGLADMDYMRPKHAKNVRPRSNFGWSPVYVDDNLGIMSIGFLHSNSDHPAIWRGPGKNGLIKVFLKDVYWEDIDFLVLDTPPGTSDDKSPSSNAFQTRGSTVLSSSRLRSKSPCSTSEKK